MKQKGVSLKDGLIRQSLPQIGTCLDWKMARFLPRQESEEMAWVQHEMGTEHRLFPVSAEAS